MKKLNFLLALSLLLIACEKDPYLIPENEIPEWLKTRITEDEQVMKNIPQSMLFYGGWLRYEWNDEYYFEYHNQLSSSMPQPISTNGEKLNFYVFDTTTDYYKEKCCKQYVWKAPKYQEFIIK